MSWSKPKVPDANEKHVKENGWEDEFGKAYKDKVEDMDKDRRNRIFPLANFSKPSIHRDDT